MQTSLKNGANQPLLIRLTLHEKNGDVLLYEFSKSDDLKLNVYKYLKNDYIKINRVIASGKGNMGIPYGIRFSSTSEKSKSLWLFLNMLVNKSFC